MSTWRHGAPGHISDDQFVWLSVGDDAEAASLRRHLDDCSACRERHRGLGAWLDDTRRIATAEADAAFNDARLVSQRERILRRLEGLGGRARVLSFPGSRRPSGGRHPGPRRWIAAAAAAGLVAGLALGRALEFRPWPGRNVVAVNSGPASRGSQVSSRVGTSNDEEFLQEIDVALAGARITELQAIDALTPRVAEIGLAPR